MRKLKILLASILVSGLAPVASAQLIFTLNGEPQPPEITIWPSDTIELGIEVLSGRTVSSFNFTYTLSNTQAEFNVDNMEFCPGPWLPWLEVLPQRVDFGCLFFEHQGPCLLMDGLIVHCLEATDVVLEIWSNPSVTVIDGEPYGGLVHTLTIHTFPPRMIIVKPDGTGDYPTIQDAINNSHDGDIIEAQPGTYTGPGNRDIDFLGKAITVRSTDPNDYNIVAATIIDCQNASGHRGFYFHSGEDANSVVSGFTIKRGRAEMGGGIYCSGSSPTIKNCVINSNKAIRPHSWEYPYGGGIYCCSNSNPIITDCSISHNTTQGTVGEDFGMDGGNGYGGAIFCTPDSNPLLINCSMISNTAKGGNGFMGGGGGTAYGGGIYCSSIKLENCLIADNVALGGDGTNPSMGNAGSGGVSYGAAIFCGSNGAVNVINCTISNNDAAGGDGGDSTLPYAAGVGGNAYGGAVYCDYNSVSTIVNCIISENTASGGDGGTLYPYPSMPIPPGEKGGDGYGGCAYCFANKQLTIENCTISGNAVLGGNGGGEGGPDGEGFAGICYSIDSSTSIINSILWDLTKGPDIIVLASQYFQSLMIIFYSDIQGGWDQVKLGNMCGILWGPGNIDADPYFADVNNSDYHLCSRAGRWEPSSKSWVQDAVTSPCIDTGDPASDWTAELWPHGKRINMGAYGGTPQASMSLSDVGNTADLDNDDFVDFDDLMLYTEKWLNQQFLLPEDLNRDGAVDFTDFAVFAENYP